jgi:integrase/recombinase XerD
MALISTTRFPRLQTSPRAGEWLDLQAALQRAPNTVLAYGRGLEDYLQFCDRAAVDPEHAGRTDIAAYVRNLAERQPSGKRLAPGVANATLTQRLTILRLFYDYLVEEGVRPLNPVSRGVRPLVLKQRRLPWIPSDEEWRATLEAARTEPLRNRLMLALAYDCALRREELCWLASGDIDPAHRTITLRAETTKTRRGRCVPYSIETGELFAAYLSERRLLATTRGPLFLSVSPRNRAKPLSGWTWSKIVRSLGLRAGVPNLSTHSFRHLCLTDLARSGWEIHQIAAFAGHRSIQSTLVYVHLSARDLSAKFARGMASVHAGRMEILRERLLQEPLR